MGARKFTPAELADETDAALVAGALRTVVVDPRGRRAKVYSRETGEVVGETDTSRVVAVLVEQQGLIAELRPEVRDGLRITSCRRCKSEFVMPKRRGHKPVFCGPCFQWATTVKCACGGTLGHAKSSIVDRLSGSSLTCVSCARAAVMRSLSPDQKRKKVESVRAALASRTAEQRSEYSRRANASRTPERRAEAARKTQAALTPERHAEARKKAWATRRAKKGAE